MQRRHSPDSIASSSSSKPSSRSSSGSAGRSTRSATTPAATVPASLWRRLALVVAALVSLATQRPREAHAILASLEYLLGEASRLPE